MKTPKVTVAIPTYNRAQFLGKAIQSVLNQSFTDFVILILDNASSDDTPQVVSAFSDPRIQYVRNEQNLGMIGNWNNAIHLANGSYLTILGDDDKMLSDFLENSIPILDLHPNVAFTFSHCNKVDEGGNVLRIWGYEFPPAGYLKGREYLYWTIKYGCCLTNSSTVLLRKNIFNKIGLFQPSLARNTFDFNMWLRIAVVYDVFFIDRILVDYTLHSGQISQLHWRTAGHPTGQIGSILEIINMISVLIERDSTADSESVRFLAFRLRELNSKSTTLLKELVPDL